jgi:hypothetical protein
MESRYDKKIIFWVSLVLANYWVMYNLFTLYRIFTWQSDYRGFYELLMGNVALLFILVIYTLICGLLLRITKSQFNWQEYIIKNKSSVTVVMITIFIVQVLVAYLNL